ncbi:MAG: diguanylate cyclase [Deltaproteobacteria bacterium]|nr:diguanylate cyclase [Deltaproteobacteria bacterium]
MVDFDDSSERTKVLGLQGLLAEEARSRKAYLIVISGRAVGKMYPVAAREMVIGRAPECDVFIDDDGVSRRHAKMVPTIEGTRLVDLGSTNGTFANNQRVDSQLLTDGDRIQIGSTTILKFSYQDDVEENFQKQLYNSATRDPLTGAYNKGFFAERLKTEFAFSSRHDNRLSLLLFDLDFFKKVNDTHGHLAGDEVLRKIATIVTGQLRTEDTFARYGGEEFAVVLRDTDAERAFLIAERIRRAVESFQFVFENKTIPLTISLGVATLCNNNFPTVRDLVQAADEFLYRAKRNGRNRTECALLR